VIGKYKIYGEIGRGSFGVVLLAKKITARNNSKFVVLKVPMRQTLKQIKETEDEIRFLFHPKYKKNCKKFYCLKETFVIEDRKVVVLDLLDGVHISELFNPRTMEGYKITMHLNTEKKKIQFVNKFAKSLIKNVQDFHRLGLSHGDIHLGNIMYLPEEGKVILVDFGMACKEQKQNYYYAQCNAGFRTGNKYFQTEKKRNTDSEMYRSFNTLKTHQSDDVFALNIIITHTIIQQSRIFKGMDSSRVPILRRWAKAFPTEIIVDENKRINAFKKFQV
jgi:serine/threonine protein kinase